MDWHLAPYIPHMERFLSLDWDIFVPGHFWCITRQEFIDILDYWKRMFDFGQQAVIDGVDPHNWKDLNAYTNEKLEARYGNQFRYYEYAAMNLSRYMQEYKTGGWGIEGNVKPIATPF
jgi:hypothetical protein